MDAWKLVFLLVYTICLDAQVFASPTHSSLVVTSSNLTKNLGESTDIPSIITMHVTSDVRNCFARTTVFNQVKNFANEAKQATFFVILPESAFISGFIMEIDGQNYTGYVEKTDEAQRIYDEAKNSGISAAHVMPSARNSNRFTVSVNIEPQSEASFYLTYEELLKRTKGQYELIINIHPGQFVKNLSVEVFIHDNRKLKSLRIPPLRSGNVILSNDSDLDPKAEIRNINETSKAVKFSPSLARQKELASLMKAEKVDGLAGQFVVQYDVERDSTGGEGLMKNGYFVHYFSPSDLIPISKHVVFVLDTSGSMHGNKIIQLKKAMMVILDQLHYNDIFHLIQFESNTKVWNLENLDNSVWFPDESNINIDDELQTDFDNFVFPNSFPVTKDNIVKAKRIVDIIEDDGGTDIYTPLRVALHLVEEARKSDVDNTIRQPVIIFLTDGEPNFRKENTTEIIELITALNSGSIQSAIFTLGFGKDANQTFLTILSELNRGFFTYIYDDTDASVQLENFYKKISTPLLSNIRYIYDSSVINLTYDTQPIYFEGSELQVAGYNNEGEGELSIQIEGIGTNGLVTYKAILKNSTSSVERVWAYLTVKELLQKQELPHENHKELKKKISNLALNYSFVTPVTSMVVVKPDVVELVNIETAVEAKHQSVSTPSSISAVAPQLSTTYYHTLANFLPVDKSNTSSTVSQPDRTYYHTFSNFHPDKALLLKSNMIEAPPGFDDEAIIEISNLMAKFSWLLNLLNRDGTITIHSENYKIISNREITQEIFCPKTPIDETEGECKLISACPGVHSNLNKLSNFVKYSCVLEIEYIGVCCPIF